MGPFFDNRKKGLNRSTLMIIVARDPFVHNCAECLLDAQRLCRVPLAVKNKSNSLPKSAFRKLEKNCITINSTT